MERAPTAPTSQPPAATTPQRGRPKPPEPKRSQVTSLSPSRSRRRDGATSLASQAATQPGNRQSPVPVPWCRPEPRQCPATCLPRLATRPRTPHEGWQHCCHPHGGNSYHQCTPRGRALDTTINHGSFCALKPTTSNSTKIVRGSRSEGTYLWGMGKDPVQQALKQPTPQPQQQSRKRADPQSDPKPIVNNSTQLAPPPLDEEEEPEDTLFFIQHSASSAS